MKQVLILCSVCLFVLLPVRTHAQTDTLKTSLRKGATAFQFRVSPNLTLSSFDGALFSGKWHMSDRRALRLGVDITGVFTDSETNTISRSINNQGDEFETSAEVDEKNNDTSLALTSYYMVYPDPGGTMNFYTGLGPFVRWSFGNDDDNTVRMLAGDRMVLEESTSEDSRITAGLGFVMGVEWFVNPRMGLTVEYAVSAFYTSFSRDLNSLDTNSVDDAQGTTDLEESGRVIRISGNGARLGLSIYF